MTRTAARLWLPGNRKKAHLNSARRSLRNGRSYKGSAAPRTTELRLDAQRNASEFPRWTATATQARRSFTEDDPGRNYRRCMHGRQGHMRELQARRSGERGLTLAGCERAAGPAILMRRLGDTRILRRGLVSHLTTHHPTASAALTWQGGSVRAETDGHRQPARNDREDRHEDEHQHAEVAGDGGHGRVRPMVSAGGCQVS